MSKPLCGAPTKSGTPCRRTGTNGCSLHPRGVASSVLAEVEDALAEVPEGWEKALARNLAAALDDEPNASMAKELRMLMAAITDDAEPEERSTADELRAKRAARQAGAAAS